MMAASRPSKAMSGPPSILPATRTPIREFSALRELVMAIAAALLFRVGSSAMRMAAPDSLRVAESVVMMAAPPWVISTDSPWMRCAPPCSMVTEVPSTWAAPPYHSDWSFR